MLDGFRLMKVAIFLSEYTLFSMCRPSKSAFEIDYIIIYVFGTIFYL